MLATTPHLPLNPDPRPSPPPALAPVSSFSRDLKSLEVFAVSSFDDEQDSSAGAGGG
jgi:hypothetical protein